MTNVSTHAISDSEFSINLSDNGGNCAVMNLNVGESTIQVFFHEGRIDKALHDIDTAIRAFLDNRK